MASQAQIMLLITGKNEASKVIKDVQKDTGGLGKALGDVAKIAGGFVVAQGIMKMGGFLFDAAQAAADDAASVMRLQKAVENTGASFDDFKGQINAVISQGQKLGFTDDQTRDSLSLLAAQTGSTEEAMKRYALAQDLSRGANIDLVTASKLLGKVTEDNVNVLSRYGIAAKEGMTETELFGMVQEKFGGQAAAFGETTAGKMEQAKIRVGELKEQLGAQLLPVMAAVMEFLVTTAIPALEKFADWVGPKIKQAIADMKPTLLDVQKVIGDVAAFIQAHWPEISAVISFGIDFVKTKIEGLIQSVKAIIEIVTSVVNLVKALWRGDWAAAWTEMKDIASASIDLFLGYLKATFGNIPQIILDETINIFNAAKKIGENLIAGLLGLPGQMLQAGKDAINGFIDGATSIDLKKVAVDLANTFTLGLSGKAGFDSHSPSRVMIPIGESIPAGLGVGIQQGTRKTKQVMQELVNGVWQTASDSVAGTNHRWVAVGEAAGTAISTGMAAGITSGAGAVAGAMAALVNTMPVTTARQFGPESSGGQSAAPSAPVNRKGLSMGGSSSGIVSLASGTSFVPNDGLAFLHRGEAVVSANQNRGGVTIVFNAPVYGMADFEQKVAEAVRTRALGGGFSGVLATS